MFKSIDMQNRTEIIIIDKQWNKHSIEPLRQKGQANQLICPQCKQPVIVKAGEIKQWHFAHRDTGTCPLRNESERVLLGRTILYHWLCTKYPGKITLEKKISGLDLPKLLDCHVTTDSGKQFAYWILESGFRSHRAIKDEFYGKDIFIHFVFLSNMIRHVKSDGISSLALTPTERSFAYVSEYNSLYTNHFLLNAALTYLELSSRRLITFRGLGCVHKPQIYSYKQKLVENLDNILISPQNGEFVYPGEYEKRKSLQAKLSKINDKSTSVKKKDHKLNHKSTFSMAPKLSSKETKSTESDPLAEESTFSKASKLSSKETKLTESDPLAYLDKEYTCKKCGKQTKEWVKLDMSTNYCICRQCMKT